MLYLAGIVLFALGLLISIGLHEIGHLVPAKRFGVKVTQYMVGFGPTLLSRRRGETEYGIKWIPLGGYIRMIGMYPPRRDHGEDEQHLRASSTGWARNLAEAAREAELVHVSADDADRAFYKLPVHRKIIVMLGGPVMNLIIGTVLMSGLLLFYGTIKATTTVGEVSKCVVPAVLDARECKASDAPTPAAQAGLRPGDKILAVDGATVRSWDAMRNTIRKSPGKPLRLRFERAGVQREVTVTPVLNRVSSDGAANKLVTVGFIGLAPTTDVVPLPAGQVPHELWSATARTGKAVINVPARMVGVAKAAFGGGRRDPEGPVGVVGISRIGGEVAAADIGLGDKFANLISLIAGLNLALFVFNLLPLLPLDGGHVAGAVYEGVRRVLARARRRPDPGPVDVARMVPLAYVVSIALIAMTAMLVYADLVNPIRVTQ